MTDYQNIPPPIDWGVVSLKSFDDQAKAADEQSRQMYDLTFGLTSPCGHCKETTNFRFGCRHILGRELEHHEGFTITRSGQYICKSCIKMIEKRKFNFATELGLVCRPCLERVVIDLSTQNPELVVDLFSKKL